MSSLTNFCVKIQRRCNFSKNCISFLIYCHTNCTHGNNVSRSFFSFASFEAFVSSCLHLLHLLGGNVLDENHCQRSGNEKYTGYHEHVHFRGVSAFGR